MFQRQAHQTFAFALTIFAVVTLLAACSTAQPTTQPTNHPTTLPITQPTNHPPIQPTDTPSETPAPIETGDTFGGADAPPLIAAYFGIFDSGYDETMNQPDQIPWDKLNRLYIAFVTLDDDGNLTNLPVYGSAQEADQRIRTLVQAYRDANPQGEIFISSTYGDELDARYLQAAQDPEGFAANVLQYLQAYDLDGYDMDWETFSINADADELVALLSACHDAFQQAEPNARGKTYQLTHTIWPGVHSAETVARLADIVDGINLMTYGENSAGDLAAFAKEYNDAGFPYEKMIAGAESEFAYSENGGPETPQSLADKAAFVRENNLSGMFSWRMDNDMRTLDGEHEGGASTFRVVHWLYDAMTGNE